MMAEDELYRELIKLFQLKEDDTIMIASDITKLALQFKAEGVSFSVDQFIEHLQRVLSAGTILIPAYTDNLRNGDVFDRQKSKPTTGALSNRIMRRKDFHRTKDPLHSVFVWGRHTDELLSLNDKSTFGSYSVFGFLDRVHAKMIIIDVHFENSFTYVHYIEEKLKVKFRKPYHLKYTLVDKGESSEEEIIFYTKRPGFTVDLKTLQNTLIENGMVTEIKFLDVPILKMDLSATGEAVREFIEKGGKTYGFDVNLFFKQVIKRILRKR